MNDLGNLQEAAFSYRKAIKIKPNYAEAHSNLGIILLDLGKLQEAEFSIRKAIEIRPNYAEAFYSLSLLKYSDKNMRWRDELFSESVFNDKSKKDKVNIYFARANVLHKERNHEESSKYLTLANKLKLEINPSQIYRKLHKSKLLLIDSVSYTHLTLPTICSV